MNFLGGSGPSLLKKDSYKGLKFSLVSVLPLYGYCGNTSLLHFHASKSINYSHNPVIFFAPSRLNVSDARRAKTFSAVGSALCTSGKTSYKDSFGLPRHCALHHAAQCHVLNKTTQTVCRQGYTAWRVEKRASGKRFCG